MAEGEIMFGRSRDYKPKGDEYEFKRRLAEKLAKQGYQEVLDLLRETKIRGEFFDKLSGYTSSGGSSLGGEKSDVAEAMGKGKGNEGKGGKGTPSLDTSSLQSGSSGMEGLTSLLLTFKKSELVKIADCLGDIKKAGGYMKLTNEKKIDFRVHVLGQSIDFATSNAKNTLTLKENEMAGNMVDLINQILEKKDK